MGTTTIRAFLLCFILHSCGSGSSKEKPADGKPTSPPPIEKLNGVEKVFGNENWMKIVNGDTSYCYFSRMPSEIQVHQYKLVKGDSVLTMLSSIRFSGDSLVWQYNDTTQLFLASLTDESLEFNRLWQEKPTAFYFGFEKKDEQHIKVTDAEKKQFMMTKTPTLSTFLVRSRYDYVHGTNYAFSDTVFSPGKKK